MRRKQISAAGTVLATLACLTGESACRPHPQSLASPLDVAAHQQLRITASGRHLLALVDAINASDSSAIHRLGSLHYSAVGLEQSGGLQRLYSRWLEISQSYGPVHVDSVMSTTDWETTAWLRGTISRAWLSVRLVTDSAPEPKIARIGIGRGITPPYADARVPAVSATRLAGHIDEYMTGLARADLFSGVVLLAHNGVPLFEGAYGVADKSSNRRFSMDTP